MEVAEKHWELFFGGSRHSTAGQLQLESCLDRLILLCLQRVESKSKQVSEKALYAVSSLVRGSQEGQHQFYSGSGVRALRNVLADAPSSSQLQKTLDLITDLTDTHGEVEVSILAVFIVAVEGM